MSINSLENVTKYSDALDKLFVQKSATGFFADTDMAKKFVGAKTVIVPDIDFAGLADYDRDNGFTRGAITVSNQSYTMQMDRARSLQIDREDMDEIGIANLAGKILGEYVRTQVVPECDAYVLSKLASIAKEKGQVYSGSYDDVFGALTNLIKNVQEAIGFEQELVAFVDNRTFSKLQNAYGINQQFVLGEFKQGEVNTQVNMLNGVPIIPVMHNRMMDEYDFDSDGGFTPADDARQVYMIVCPKKGAHLVCKTEKMRIFTPDQNVDADAYKFDYRIYYDLFVKKSELSSIWAWISPEYTIAITPSKSGALAAGDKLSAVCSLASGVTYQWYTADDNLGSNPQKITGATTNKYTLPSGIEAGTYYFMVKATLNDMVSKYSEVITVTVETAD